MVDIKELFLEYGSPLYVFHDAEFIENYEHLCRAMREYYPNYSYKTNYILLSKVFDGLESVYNNKW